MKNNENGRSMVEMLGVLAIIGVLSAGGLAGYSKAMFKHKMNSTLDQLTMLVTNIRTMYGTQDNYDGLSASQAIKLGIIPAAMQGANSTLVSPFKGPVTIVATSATTAGVTAQTGAAATAFAVTYSGLPAEACINLATADWGSGAGSGFIGVSTGAGQKSGEKVGDTKEGRPLSVGEAISGCPNDQSSVTVKFY